MYSYLPSKRSFWFICINLSGPMFTILLKYSSRTYKSGPHNIPSSFKDSSHAFRILCNATSCFCLRKPAWSGFNTFYCWEYYENVPTRPGDAYPHSSSISSVDEQTQKPKVWKQECMPMVNKLLCVHKIVSVVGVSSSRAARLCCWQVYTTRIARCLSLLNNGVCASRLKPCPYLFS